MTTQKQLSNYTEAQIKDLGYKIINRWFQKELDNTPDPVVMNKEWAILNYEGMVNLADNPPQGLNQSVLQADFDLVSPHCLDFYEGERTREDWILEAMHECLDESMQYDAEWLRLVAKEFR